MVLTGPDNIAFQNSNGWAARLGWLAAGLLIGARALGLWQTHPAANWMVLAGIGFYAAIALAALLQAAFGMQKTVYFDLAARTGDVFYSVMGKSFGRTFGFDQVYRIRIVTVRPQRVAGPTMRLPTYYRVEVLLKGRSSPIARERFDNQPKAAEVAAELHQAVFGSSPEPWMLEGLDPPTQPVAALSACPPATLVES